MVDPRKLLLLAASVNSRGDHLTQVQERVLTTEELRKHGRDLTMSRKDRRIAKAKVRVQMGLDKPEFDVPELQGL